MSVKVLVTGVAAAAAIGAAAVGVTSPFPIPPAAFGAPSPAPYPQDPPPAANLPTAEELTNILTNLADPGVKYSEKDGLVEGGIDPGAGHGIDHELRKAYRNGDLPLTFNVTNIQPAGPNQASADVTIGGPKLPAPVTKNLTFVNQSGWMLSQDSANALIQEAMTH